MQARPKISQPIEHTIPVYRLMKTPTLYIPTQGKHRTFCGHDSYSWKLRQGEKMIANKVTPIIVRMVAKANRINMKGKARIRKMDLMKFQQRGESIIELLS